MTASWNKAGCLAIALSAIAASACSDTVDLNGAHDELATDIGTTARDEVESSVAALTLSTSLAPIGGAQAASRAAFLIPACVNPTSAGDTDGDGVPDDATYVFTTPPCEFDWRGGKLELVGQFRIQDPVPATAGFGYAATLTDFRTRFISADAKTIADITRNGTRTLSGSISGLLLTTQLQVKRNFPQHPDATLDKEWTVNFNPSTPLLINGELPSGTLDIAGSATWDRGPEEHFEFTITTPEPLQYDATCTSTAQRIKAGELHAAGLVEGDEGFFRVRWTECGKEPQFSFEKTPS